MVENITKEFFLILNLFKNNYLNEFHIRKISRILKKSHVSLLPYIKILEQKNILKYKYVGRSKVYSLNLDNIITKHYLFLVENYNTINFLEENFFIKKLFEEINSLNLKGSFIVFGSYAKKTFDEKSDIDILYIGKISGKNIEKVKNIAKIYNKKVDFKTVSLKNFERGIKDKDPLIMEVLDNHIILNNFEIFIDTLWRVFNEKR